MIGQECQNKNGGPIDKYLMQFIIRLIMEAGGRKSLDEMAIIVTIPLWQNLPSPFFAKEGTEKTEMTQSPTQ
jgi:hypothetical protein